MPIASTHESGSENRTENNQDKACKWNTLRKLTPNMEEKSTVVVSLSSIDTVFFLLRRAVSVCVHYAKMILGYSGQGEVPARL